MTAPTNIRKGYVAGEFLTRLYRISGEVTVQTDPLLDQLNDMALFIQLERVFTSSLLDPALLSSNARLGQVRKDNLGLVVLGQLRDGLPRREGQYMGRDHVDRHVLVMVGGFEIQGVLRLHPSVDVSNFVRTTPERFIPLFEATAAMAANRDIVFNGGAILVNRAQIEIFCLVER